MALAVRDSNFNLPTTASGRLAAPLAPALPRSSNLWRDRFESSNEASSRVLKGAAGHSFSNATRANVRVMLPAVDTAGALADWSLSQTKAMQDFTELQRLLVDPSVPPALKLAAAAKATQSASAFVTKQQVLVNTIRETDENYLSNATYQRLTQDARASASVRALSELDQAVMPRVLRFAQVAGTSAGVVVGVLTLPKLVQGVKASYKQLQEALYGSHVTGEKRLDAVADFSRASAGTLQGVQGLHMSLVGLGELAQSSKTFGGLATRIQSFGVVSRTNSWITGFLRVLSPLADTGMLVADLVKLKHALTDPQATFWTQVRMGVNVGIDALKLGSWLMPQTAAIRFFYLGTSYAQLGLTVYDFGQTLLGTHAPKSPVVPASTESMLSSIKHVGATLTDSARFVGQQWHSLLSKTNAASL